MYHLVIIILKKYVQYETNKAAVFDLPRDTCMLDSENATKSLGGSYRTISDNMD